MLRTKYHSSGASIPLRPWSATPQGVFFDLSSDCLSLFLFPWMHILDRAGKQTGKSKVAWFADQILFKPWLNIYIYLQDLTGVLNEETTSFNLIQNHEDTKAFGAPPSLTSSLGLPLPPGLSKRPGSHDPSHVRHVPGSRNPSPTDGRLSTKI